MNKKNTKYLLVLFIFLFTNNYIFSKGKDKFAGKLGLGMNISPFYAGCFCPAISPTFSYKLYSGKKGEWTTNLNFDFIFFSSPKINPQLSFERHFGKRKVMFIAGIGALSYFRSGVILSINLGLGYNLSEKIRIGARFKRYLLSFKEGTGWLWGYPIYTLETSFCYYF